MNLSPLLKILIVFAAMLALNRARLPLGVALVLGGLALEGWAGKSLSLIGSDFGAALTRPELWLLLLTTVLIQEFGHYLAEEKNAAAILASVRRLGGRYGRAVSLMVLPAAIGLVPMAGGALFSAPLVAQTVREEGWTSGWKSAVNYWFRHVWEYWWPLYPVVIVSIPIFQMETWQFMAAVFLFSPVAMVSGYFFLVRPHLEELGRDRESQTGRTDRSAFLWIPLVLVLICTLVLPWPLDRCWPGLTLPVRKLVAMLIGLVAGLALMGWDQRRQGNLFLFREVFSRKSFSIMLTLCGVLIFESLLTASDLLPRAATDLSQSGIPVPLIVALLPLVAGLVTGVAVGFAGTAFPLIVGLLSQPDSTLTPMSTLALAFGFGYAGMMLSPVHLCFVLTRNYFSATFPSIYLQILPCVITLLAASVGLYFAWELLGG